MLVIWLVYFLSRRANKSCIFLHNAILLALIIKLLVFRNVFLLKTHTFSQYCVTFFLLLQESPSGVHF